VEPTSVVGAAIRSVLAQDFSDWGLTVVDDGSADDTASVVNSFKADSRIHFLQIPHAGLCKAAIMGKVLQGALSSLIWMMIISGTQPS
jgi:glycosyltransferase involved in cell wall biosynthesis